MKAALRRPDVVPFIAAWSGEPPNARNLVYSDQGGIAFSDEVPADRDEFGVLWNDRAMSQGRGRPRYDEVHPSRQRVVMQGLLCQVCARPADRDQTGGVLWVVEDQRGEWSGWPENLSTAHPPLCLPCASKAVEMCPHLVDSNVAVRARDSEVWAVHGRTYAPSAFGLPVKTANKEVVAYGSAAARWVLAGQLVRSLHECTVVDLQQELARLA